MSRTRCSLMVLAACALVTPVRAQNLVVNGDFEAGTSGWNGGSAVADNPHGGSSCLLVLDDNSSASVAAATSATLAIAQRQAYVFEAWVRAPVEGQQTLVTLNQYDASDAWISGNNMDFVVTAGTAWTRFSITVRSFNPLTAGVRISLRPVRWTSAGELLGSAWFDDLRLEPISISDSVRGQWLVQGGALQVWRSPVEQNVLRDQMLPGSAPVANGIAMAAARGEFEPFELVLCPGQATTLTGVSVSTLSGPAGANLAPSAWVLREVVDVEVTQPTDWGSATGWRPDPLPLLELPLVLSANQQHALWFTVEVPRSQAPGVYSGSVTLQRSTGGDLVIPLSVQVHDFALPVEHHLRTAYNLSLREIDRYHHLQGDRDLRRQTLQRYLEDFAAHRVSPQDPFGDDGFRVSFPEWNWQGGGLVNDPAPVGTASTVLELDDTSTTAQISARTSLSIPIQAGQDYVLAWRVRSDGAHDYLVSVNQYDATDAWISGHNLDQTRDGDGTWQDQSLTLTASQFTAQTTQVRITLYARRWTSAGELTGRTWFDDVSLQKAGDSTELVVNGNFDIAPDAIQPVVDFSDFDVAASLALDSLGFDAFRLALPFFAWGSYQGGQPGQLLQFTWGTPEYESLYTRMLQAITSHLADRGWLSKAYTYWFDEPEPVDYTLVVQGMDLLHSAEPRLRRLLTEQFESELAGHVDIWTPLLDQFADSWAQQRQALGEEVWWYVCTGPRAPYPNNFIDHPAIETRVRFWMAWQHGVQGSLYWQTNYWTNDQVSGASTPQDPWQDPMSYNFDTGNVGTWGNGDGRLLYPPRAWADNVQRIEGPTPSLRWELIREGIEDYEYFWMLRDLSDRLAALVGDSALVLQTRDLLVVPATIASSAVEYTDDSALLAAHRAAVATAIEQVQQALDSVTPRDAGVSDRGAADALSVDGTADATQPTDASAPDGALTDLATDASGSDQDAASARDAGGDDVMAVDGWSVGQDAFAHQDDAGYPTTQPGGCACTASKAPVFPLLGLLLFAASWRRRKR
ncbi:MAG: glycoside hydrolase domain-containing protein [Pseudomonadota bacterium]